MLWDGAYLRRLNEARRARARGEPWPPPAEPPEAWEGLTVIDEAAIAEETDGLPQATPEEEARIVAAVAMGRGLSEIGGAPDLCAAAMFVELVPPFPGVGSGGIRPGEAPPAGASTEPIPSFQAAMDRFVFRGAIDRVLTGREGQMPRLSEVLRSFDIPHTFDVPSASPLDVIVPP
jgi:hypothetical protein